MNKSHKLPCEKVIEDNIGLVKKIVSRFYVSDFDKDDLMQAGLTGLWKAAYHYDEKIGVKFSTYSVKYILGEIKEEIKKMNIIKVSRKYYKIINEINNMNYFNEEQIIKKLGCTSYDIKMAICFINNKTIIDENKIIDYRDNLSTNMNDKIEKIISLSNEKITQKEIAKRLMISQSTVSRILKRVKDNV